eukprot:398822_1
MLLLALLYFSISIVMCGNPPSRTSRTKQSNTQPSVERNQCFDICIQNSIEELSKLQNAGKFTLTKYIIDIPQCINKMGYTDKFGEINEPTKRDKECPFKGNLKKNVAYIHLRKFFKCMNRMHQQNTGGLLWNKNPPVIAWSGAEAQEKAKKITNAITKQNCLKKRKNQPTKCVQLTAVGQALDVISRKLTRKGGKKSGEKGDKKGCKKNTGGKKGSKKDSKGCAKSSSKDEQLWMPTGRPRARKTRDLGWNLLSLWLINHANWKKPVDQYSSIDFPKDKTNKKRKAFLKNAGITKALTINTVFWNVEMITLFRNAKKSSKKPKLFIHMLEYNDNGKPMKRGWEHKVDLFGKVKDLKNIPIIIATVKDAKNMKLYAPQQIFGNEKQIKNLLELIIHYNSKNNNKLKTDGTFLENELKNLVSFVQW